MSNRHPSREQVQNYIGTIRPVMVNNDLADYMGVSFYTARRWLSQDGYPGKRSDIDKLGRLAATITFLETELSFDEDGIKNHLKGIFIDADTYQPTTMLEQIGLGNSSVVIQKAIELSVE